jgi:hypothetical protein
MPTPVIDGGGRCHGMKTVQRTGVGIGSLAVPPSSLCSLGGNENLAHQCHTALGTVPTDHTTLVKDDIPYCLSRTHVFRQITSLMPLNFTCNSVFSY